MILQQIYSETVYQISSELLKFYERYYQKNHFGFFFWTHCRMKFEKMNFHHNQISSERNRKVRTEMAFGRTGRSYSDWSEVEY